MIKFSFSLDPNFAAATFDRKEIMRAFGADQARHLGSGSFGETWLVESGSTRQAVKILFEMSHRIERELKSLKLCKGANIVHLLGHGNTMLNNLTVEYIAFEYVDGGNLVSHISNGNWPTVKQLNSFAIGVLRGLNEIHSNNIIHRDINFNNIILRGGRYNDPVIIDLGIARVLDMPTLTRYPALMGTAPFMAPEQLSYEKARKATDLWALGVLLYLLAAKRHPFFPFGSRFSMTQALKQICGSHPPYPQQSPPI